VSKKEDLYRWVKFGGLVSVIPFILFMGPFLGYLIGGWLKEKFSLGSYAVYIFIGLGFIWSFNEAARIIIMLAIHDLPELYCGDAFFFSKNQKDEKKEMDAAKRIFFKDFPQPIGSKLYHIWLEFFNGETKEAKIARAIDYLQPGLQNINTSGAAWIEHGITLKDIDTHKRKVVSEAGDIFNKIYDEFFRRAAKIIS